MDFLLALVAPALSKSLEVCFLTGFATAYRLKEAQRGPRGGLLSLPRLRHGGPSRSDSLLASRPSGKHVSKDLPNDPGREGNIWHQYEQLQRSQDALEKQLFEERAVHKKELKRLESQVAGRQRRAEDDLPPTKAPEDFTTSELLEQLNTMRTDIELLSTEVSDAHNLVDFLRSEKDMLKAENLQLQRAAASNEPAAQKSRPPTKNSPFESSGPPVAVFADEAAGPSRNKNGQEPLITFGSDIEFDPNFKKGLNTPDGGAKPPVPRADSQIGQSGRSVSVEKLSEDNKFLQIENARLQKKLLNLDRQRPDPEWQERYDTLVQENTRLQNKVLRLNFGGDESGAAEIEALQSDIKGLERDNDRLVTFLESLEKEKEELEARLLTNSGSQRAAATIDQLTADKAAMLDALEKMKEQLKNAKLLSANGSFTIPIPVDVATGAEQDTELWVIVEDLRHQNRTLIEENQLLKTKTNGVPSAFEDSGDYAGNLAQENAAMQQEIIRLQQSLTSGVPPKERDVLDEAIRTNERLVAEKKKANALLQRMQSKNEELFRQIHSPENINNRSKETLAKAESKGLLSNVFSGRRRSKSGKLAKDSKVPESDDEHSMGSSLSGALRRGDSPNQLVDDLLNQTSKLTEENRNLAARADVADSLKAENEELKESLVTLKELERENSNLLQENQQLLASVETLMAENRELGSRALERTIEAALGEGEDSGSSAISNNTPAPNQPDIKQPGSMQSKGPVTVLGQRISMGKPGQGSPWDTYGESGSPWGGLGSSASASSNPLIQLNSSLPPLGGGLRRKSAEAQERNNLLRTEFNLGDYIEKSRKLAEDTGSWITDDQKDLACKTVDKAFAKHEGAYDLGSVMKMLGFAGFEPAKDTLDDDETYAIYQRACAATYEVRISDVSSPNEKLLAESTAPRLEAWYVKWVENAPKGGDKKS